MLNRKWHALCHVCDKRHQRESMEGPHREMYEDSHLQLRKLYARP